MTFLRRFLDEKEPTLENFAQVVRKLEQRQPDKWPAGSAVQAAPKL